MCRSWVTSYFERDVDTSLEPQLAAKDPISFIQVSVKSRPDLFFLCRLGSFPESQDIQISKQRVPKESSL